MHTGKPIVVLGRKLRAKREFRLFKFGDNPTVKGTFRLTQESAAELMATYAKRGLKVTFDYDHYALKGSRPQDGKSAGKCDLELREDGLYCTNIEWTPTAQKEIEDGEWVYFSPAFESTSKTKEICELINVALTNVPAMDGIEAIAASRQAVACVIKREGGKYVLYDSSGKKKLGEHATEAEAKAQESAVNISKAREAGHPIPKASTEMHPVVKKLKEHMAKSGKDLGHAAGATGIHLDRMKALHDDGEAPSPGEVKALGQYMSLSAEELKAIGGGEEDEPGRVRPEPTKASALDGQEVDKMKGDGDDDVEHEDLAGPAPTMANREMSRALTLLTGTADPKKQQARLQAMRTKADQYDEDHKTVVALKQEREAEKLNALIEKGKADGKLTPSSLGYWRKRGAEELEEYLAIAPVVLNTRSQTIEVKSADGKETAMLTREEAEVARHCGIDESEMVEAKKLVESDMGAEIKKQRFAMTKMYKQQDKEPVRGVIATRKEFGVQR